LQAILPVSCSSSEHTKDADGPDWRDFTPLIVALELAPTLLVRVEIKRCGVPTFFSFPAASPSEDSVHKHV